MPRRGRPKTTGSEQLPILREVVVESPLATLAEVRDERCGHRRAEHARQRSGRRERPRRWSLRRWPRSDPSWPAPRVDDSVLQLGLLGDLERVLDLDAEVAHGALQLGVP